MKFYKLIIFLFVTSIAFSCAKQTSNGIQASNTSSYLGGFVKIDTCTPTLIWQSINDPNNPQVTYDVVVHSTLKTNRDIYDNGDQVFYAENISGTSVQVTPSLLPRSFYFWSVRVRLPDGKVSQWSTYNKTTNLVFTSGVEKNHWFGVKTPEQCN